jgi:hypothetical protein
MKPKNVISIVLLLFVAASVVYLIVGESRSRSEPSQPNATASVAPATPEPAEAGAPKAPEESADAPEESAKAPEESVKPQHKLIAYYFHRTQRCPTCLKMEAYARDVLTEGLYDAFESGELEWRAVNVEEPQNEHFVMEYELSASALVMVSFENGEQKQWKDLERVWDLVSDEWAFKEYVRNEATAYLESGS